MTLPETARQLLSKVEVLKDLEVNVRQMMAVHEEKRELWYPSELIGPAPGECPDTHRQSLRKRAEGVPDHVRAALALNLLTEEGLPHFHRLLAVYLGNESHWSVWNNLWTAEEDRHGQVLHDYTRDASLFDQRRLEEMQFEYLRAGFQPEWDHDPYRVFAYTTLQERATQHSHAATGIRIAEHDEQLAMILDRIAREEARHYAFYRTIMKEILDRDPNQGLQSIAEVMPSIDMPGHTMPGFRELADAIRRSGIYGPRDYLRIVTEQIRYWKIEVLEGLSELGRKAQERILSIPNRLSRVADAIEARSKAKTFNFEVVFHREFALE